MRGPWRGRPTTWCHTGEGRHSRPEGIKRRKTLDSSARDCADQQVMVKALRGETRHVIPFPSMVRGTDHRTAGVWVLRSPAKRRTDVRTGSTRCRPGKNSALFPVAFNVSSRSLSPPGARHTVAVWSAFVFGTFHPTVQRVVHRAPGLRQVQVSTVEDSRWHCRSARRDVSRDGCCARFGLRPGMCSALSYLQAVCREIPISLEAEL